MSDKPIYVVQPSLPPFDEFADKLRTIWDRKILTNGGPLHQELEKRLAEYLGVPQVALFNNATIALLTALQALGISGEVITTPYSFVATTHSLMWNNLTPVFVDVDPATLNIDPAKIEAAITPKTSAIMAVHCYGTPCDVKAIEDIARRHNLKVLYDAAHAFAVDTDKGSVLNYGDLSVLSFHATKVFNTFEGGAIICPDLETKKRIDRLKNFGIVDETHVEDIGLNGKMSEANAAFGLVQLDHVGRTIEQRKIVNDRYRALLSDVPGIACLDHETLVKRANFAYFPVLVGKDCAVDRDRLYEHLKTRNIFARRYFYPLISEFPMYRSMPSADPALLPIAADASGRVLCLPMYPDLPEEDQIRIVNAIKEVA